MLWRHCESKPVFRQQLQLIRRKGAAKLTSSSGSLIAKAAERAGVMSTSSTSFEMSPNARFQSSANGPDVVSLGRVPTFFY
jgi:hypothetical protein